MSWYVEKSRSPIPIARIQDAFTKIDADVVRVTNDTRGRPAIPGMLARKAIVIDMLQQVGISTGLSADETFRRAVQFANVTQVFWLERYYYARYLAAQNATQNKSQITDLLSVYSATHPSALYFGVKNFFVAARTNTSLADDKRSLQQLGRFDASFKAYLLSIGWENSDF